MFYNGTINRKGKRGGKVMLQKYMMAKEFYTTEKAWLIQQSMHRYSISSYILFFFTFSFAGWLWEVLLHVFIDHTVVNRGVLYGPWLPIYGFGGVLILLLLRRFAERPLQVFLMTMLTAGTMEFVTGTVLWKVYQMRWWDYRDSLINLKGFVCLEGLLLFGAGGLVILYFAAPKLSVQYRKLPDKFRTVLCICLLGIFVIDVVFSLMHPNAGFGVTVPRP